MDKFQWFRDAKFGMMVHWGLYALPAGEWRGRRMGYIGEWIQSKYRIPNREYHALTRAFNPAVMTWAALCAILLSMVAKVGAFLSCIPAPVMGGIMILLFGAIMVVGLNTLVRAGQDLLRPRNMVIVALIIIFGVGGMQVSIGGFKLAGIGLAAITGVVLNLLLPQDDPQG